MNDILIQPVETAQQRRIFLNFPRRIYKDDPNWVPPVLRERTQKRYRVYRYFIPENNYEQSLP